MPFLNKSSSNFPQGLLLQDQADFLETSNYVNMHFSLFQTIVGLMGNIFTIIVLTFSRKKQPRIVNSSYLIILAITNTVYMLIHFNTDTYNRMVYFFKIDHLQLLHSNIFACKTVYYLKYASRYMNTLLNVCFSVERLLAVFSPLKIRHLRSKRTFMFSSSIFVSFSMAIYYLIFFELVPKNDVYSSDFNQTKVINYHLPIPNSGNYVCTLGKRNLWIKLAYNSASLILILSSYLFVSGSILAIIFKLRNPRNNNLHRVQLNTSRTNSSLSRSMISPRSEITHNDETISRQILSSYFQNYQCGVSLRTRRRHENMLHDSKMLIWVSIGFILFNTPFYAFLVFSSLYTYNSSNVFLLHDRVVFNLKSHSFLVIADIFQLLNFSLTGILFLFTERIYRLNALICMKKTFNCC